MDTVEAASGTAGNAASNEYAGFSFPSTGVPYALEEVPVEKLGTEWFWKTHVQARKPCVLIGKLPGFHGDRWSNS